MLTSHVSADTPIFQLTVGEFLELLTKHGLATSSSVSQSENCSGKRYIYGIAGLARLLDCSHPTAHKLKASGKIPFSTTGRKLIFEEQAVLSALNKSTSKK